MRCRLFSWNFSCKLKAAAAARIAHPPKTDPNVSSFSLANLTDTAPISLFLRRLAEGWKRVFPRRGGGGYIPGRRPRGTSVATSVKGSVHCACPRNPGREWRLGRDFQSQVKKGSARAEIPRGEHICQIVDPRAAGEGASHAARGQHPPARGGADPVGRLGGSAC